MERDEDTAQSSLIYRMAWIFYLVLALAGVLWIGWREGRIGLDAFVNPSTWWIDLGAGLAGGALLLGVWALARRYFPAALKLESQLAEVLGPLVPGEIIGLALISGFSEELFFRAAVQGSWGWFPATVLFALLHTGPGRTYRIWTVFAGVAGLVLAGLMIWRNNLLAPVVAHALVNGYNLGKLTRGRA